MLALSVPLLSAFQLLCADDRYWSVSGDPQSLLLCILNVSAVGVVWVWTSNRCIIIDERSSGRLERNQYVYFQTTHPTSGGAVIADSSCCANCVELSRPQQWVPDLPFFGHASHADPLDGWRCCSQKQVMSRPIQVR